jgi:hypothetical protein
MNFHTLKGIAKMNFLHELDWGILHDGISPASEIPFHGGFHSFHSPSSSLVVGEKDESVEIDKLLHFICNTLADTRIRLFRVPKPQLAFSV